MGNAMIITSDGVLDGPVRYHRFRYHLAKGFISLDDKVIDLGCGTGYGSDMLAEFAMEVTGIDIDRDNIAFANKNNKQWNINFVIDDLEKMVLPKCDVAVQFENLEHLYNPKAFVKKLKKVTSKFIVMSVPMGVEKLITVDGNVQADLDSTHHSVFNCPDDVRILYEDDNWKEYWSFTDGVTFIAVFYKI